ncbi:MAG: disulfide bond formation protein B [Alphaproteobacteria bacterium]|nr:MAG: disulfide bond formation protein B [Alphaproteobacteria bacterium]
MTSRLRSLWPLLTALTSGAMLAAAHLYFQRFLGLAPCPLCLDQRNWHWAVLGVSLLVFLLTRWKPGLLRWGVMIVGLVLLGSAAQAAYHVAVEQHWVIAQCDVRSASGQSLTFDPNAPLEVPQCDEIAWSWLGISMAGYNAIISFVLALTSFVVALAPERKP